MEVGEFSDDGKYVEFSLNGKKMKFEKIDKSVALAGEQKYERPVIKVPEITLGLRKVTNVPLAITKNREGKTTNLLLNRDVLSKFGYVVHPAISHILTKEMEKVKIL